MQAHKKNYPTWLYHEEKAPEGVIVYSEKQEKSLGEGWLDTPALFGSKKQPEQKSAPKKKAMSRGSDNL